MDLTQLIPVGIAMALMQVIKVLDPNDKLEKFYPAVATVIAVIVGILYGLTVGHTTAPQILLDAVENAGGAALAWQLKEAATKPSGTKIPGDKGTGGQT